MSSEVRSALRVWRGRRVTTTSDHAYVAYVVVVLAVVVAAPLARALWIATVSDKGAAVLDSARAADLVGTLVAAAWVGLLLLGSQRGPALRPLVVTWALATSATSRAQAFGHPFVAATAGVTLAFGAAAAVVGWSAVSRTAATPLDACVLTAAGLLAGMVGAHLWLLGQARASLAGGLAMGIVAAETLAFVVPAIRGAAPWGWVGLTWPGESASPWPVVGLLALAATLVAMAPSALSRLELDGLLAHAARWESVTAFAGSMEFSSAVALFQARPRVGRRFSAVRAARSLVVLFIVRSAVGAARTPARFIAAVAGLVAGGALIVVATTATSTTAMGVAGAFAAFVVFVSLGPLTDGLRHAMYVVADNQIYGIEDARLVGLHLLFPAGVLLLALPAGAGLAAASSAAGLGNFLIASATSFGLGLFCLVARLSIALKGPLPPELLTPVPTPVGDLSVVVQVAWALDGLLLSIVAGATVLQAAAGPWFALTAALLLSVAARRWRRRGA